MLLYFSLKLNVKALHAYIHESSWIKQTLLWQRLDVLRDRSLFMAGGWYRREMFFVAKILLTQPLKSQKFDYPTSNIN
jgi:hypothetical protein